MKFTYTKQVEISIKDAMEKANEYLKSKGYEYAFFDIVKSEKTETTIYLYASYMQGSYKVSGTLEYSYFEKSLARFLKEIYEEVE